MLKTTLKVPLGIVRVCASPSQVMVDQFTQYRPDRLVEAHYPGILGLTQLAVNEINGQSAFAFLLGTSITLFPTSDLGAFIQGYGS